MRRHLLAAVLLLPASLHAQGPGLIVHAGATLPTGDIGPAAPAEGPWFLQLEQADPAFTFGASLALPLDATLGARLTGLAALGSAAHGFFNCYDGLACPAILIESTVDIRTVTGLAELTWAPFGGGIQPYALAGAGVRHASFSWEDVATELVGEGDGSDTALLLRAGLGFAVPLGAWRLHLEITDAWSPATSLDAPNAPGRVPERNALNHVTLTAGIRLF